VGLKPTYGRVPRDGVLPLAWSLDHVGPMARSVGECEAILQALAPEFAPHDDVALEDLRVALVWDEHAQPGVAACVRAAAAHFPNMQTTDFDEPSERDRGHVSDLFQTEVADVHRELYAEHAELYSDEVAAKIESCLRVGADAASAGLEARRRYQEWGAEVTGDLDLLLTPTIPCVAPPAGLGEPSFRGDLIHFTFPFNALGWPALALPCGAAEDGLPASIQLVGKPGDDALVLAAGRALASLIRGTATA
jgi:Asp-tRNA(Asn)/Glu-tRNA(Gln) amidotransferase A subunit family amidase